MKYFKQALVADWVRGKHSTGIAVLNSGDTEVSMKKAALNPCDFLELKSVDSMLTNKAIGLLGHNRAATVGKVNAANAHPFQHGNITLAHNGTLTNKYALQQRFNAPVFDTDSELLCWLIDNEDLAEVVKYTEGAFALTWIDSDDGSFHFITNGERPFHILQDGNTLYWGSEKKMVEWLLDRNCYVGQECAVLPAVVGRHYSYHLTKGVLNRTTEDLELAPQKKYTTAGRGTHTTKSKTKPVSSTTRGANYPQLLRGFNEKHGFDWKVGSTVYMYVEDVEKCATSQNGSRVNVHGCLACDPYTPVSVYWTPTNEKITEKVYALEVKLRFVTQVKGNFQICVENKPEDIKVVSTLQEVEACEDWLDKYDSTRSLQPEAEPDSAEKDTPCFVTGYEDKHLVYNQFRDICESGCCMCGDPADPEAEAVDRTITFTDSDQFVCSGCVVDTDVRNYLQLPDLRH